MPLCPVSSGVDMPAVWAGSIGIGAVIKLVINPRQVFNNAVELDLGAVYPGTAVGAIPLKAVDHAHRARALNDQT